jgi:hypothetical protein
LTGGLDARGADNAGSMMARSCARAVSTASASVLISCAAARCRKLRRPVASFWGQFRINLATFSQTWNTPNGGFRAFESHDPATVTAILAFMEAKPMNRVLAGPGEILPLGGDETVLMTQAVALTLAGEAAAGCNLPCARIESQKRTLFRQKEAGLGTPNIQWQYHPPPYIGQTPSIGRRFKILTQRNMGKILEKLTLYLGTEALLSGGVRLVEPCRAQGF